MGALTAYCGTGSRHLLERMSAALAHRARGGAAYHTTRHAGAAVRADARNAPDTATAGEGPGAVLCAFDGQLFDASALAEKVGLPAAASAATIVAHGFRDEGPRFFDGLDGAFVLAVVRGDELHVARDALGERAVYYTTVGGTTLVASEAKAFLAHPGFRVAPDLGSLTKLLVFSFIPGRETMFQGVYELPPGTRLVVRAGGHIEQHRYWDLAESADEATESELVERIRALVRRAVTRRLGGRTSVSAFLSGGIDSSAVVAVLADQGVNVTAFTAGFGHGVPNELAYAKLVAEHCRVEHRIVEILPEGFIDLLPSIIWQLDDPLCDCITVPNYLSPVRRAARAISSSTEREATRSSVDRRTSSSSSASGMRSSADTTGRAPI